MDKKELLAAVLKYVDVKGLLMEVLLEEVVYGIAVAKIKEAIPGEVDDAILEASKPMVKAAIAEWADEKLADLMPAPDMPPAA